MTDDKRNDDARSVEDVLTDADRDRIDDASDEAAADDGEDVDDDDDEADGTE
jgi:hypothetical protein